LSPSQSSGTHLGQQLYYISRAGRLRHDAFENSLELSFFCVTIAKSCSKLVLVDSLLDHIIRYL